MLLSALPIAPTPAVQRRRRGDAFFLAGAVALQILAVSPAGAFDLFPTREVTAQFATPDGKPMANAEVRAFSPADPNEPAVSGRTDAEGKFVFAADRDGFWSAEARSSDYVARVMIRVGAEQQSRGWLSPVFVVGFLVIMLALAIWYRLLRARARQPKP
jgi:nickel transport protein